MCRHCQRLKASRAHNLCWRCSFDPAIRSLYPSTSHRVSKLPAANGYTGYNLPNGPTTALAGSEAKIAELADRARQGVSLWHPEDERRMEQKQPEEVGRHFRETK